MTKFPKSAANTALAMVATVFTSCTDAPTDVPILHGRHFSGYTETALSHKFIVSDLTFNRSQVPSGWELGVFTDGGILAGSLVWNDSSDNVLKAWGADSLEDLFHTGDRFDFRVWDNQTEHEYYADASWSNGQAIWRANGLAEITVDGFIARDMTVHLVQGWNLISINVNPNQIMYNDNGPDVRKMMKQFIAGDRSHLIVVKNERGNFYVPANNDFNNIPFWNVAEGYIVLMDSTIDAHWTGRVIEAGDDVPIAGGWNLIAYYPTYPLSCDSITFNAISNIRENVILLRDLEGHFASPRHGFSNMPPLREGKGYRINVDSPVILRYPEPEASPLPEPADDADFPNSPWTRRLPTEASMSVLLTTIAGVEVHHSDAVAAFSTSGRLVGLAHPTGGKVGLAIWGDDHSTEAVDGLLGGEAFTLKYWSSQDSTIRDLRLGSVDAGGGLVFETDGLTVCGAVVEP